MCERCRSENPEEYEIQELAQLQSVVKMMPGSAIELLLKLAVSEIYIRSSNNEQWEKAWDNIVTGFNEIFDPLTPKHPELIEHMNKERERLNEIRRKRTEVPFAGGVDGVLDELFKTHGVLDKDPTDEAPGQYL